MFDLQFHRQPVQRNSLIRIVFTVWSESRKSQLPMVSHSGLTASSSEHAYDPRRCLTLHMYERRGEFASKLRRIFDQFEGFFSAPACKHLIGIVGMATSFMSYSQIKLLSYKGAVYIRGYWYDPGNFMYTLWWHIWAQFARHLQRRSRPSRASVLSESELRNVASRVTDIQRMVRQRWHREPDAPQWLELVGDLMELSLGLGYVDQERFWCLIKSISPIIDSIRDVVLFIDNHGPFSRIGRHGSFFIGSCAPCTRKLAVSMYHAMLVHRFNISESASAWPGYLEVASHNRLMY